MTAARGDVRRTVALFRRFAAGQRRSFVLALVLLVAEAGTAVLQPYPLAYLIDFLQGNREGVGFAPSRTGTIAVLTAVIVLLAAMNSLTDSLAEISLAKGGRTLGYNLRVALYGHLQRLSLAFHVHRRTGDVLTRITGDVTALEDFVVGSLSDIAGSVLVLVGTLAFLLTRSVQVTLLALVIVPLLAGVSNVFARRVKTASKRLRAREGDLASSAQEMLTSIGVVQSYGRTDYEQSRFAERSQATLEAALSTARIEAAFSFTVSVLQAVVIAVVVWVGVVFVDRSTITVGTLVLFILLVENMFKPTRRIIKEWNTVGKIYASVERISELLDREPAVQNAPDAVPAPRLRGTIELRDVSFAYQRNPDEVVASAPTRLALDEVSFTIPAGQVVALVGHSGAGKSTIAQLVPRLYDPHAGTVLVDGHDVRTLTIESLRGQIGMVLQETVLFSGTVAENIAYGREGASRDDVVAAARHAHAHDFITALPDGYDTVLGERAATLSGGQRQRLAIARAFIRDSPILVLDEPTTGLDAESSDLVVQALRSLVRGKTALIISHDLNLVRVAQRILVLSAGRLLEDGTPADLLAREGLYAELYARQFGGAAGEAVPASPAIAATPVQAPDGEAAPPPARAFETVLMQAVPLPASQEAFQQLTGRIPVAGAAAVPTPRQVDAAPSRGAPRRPEDDDDPLHSPGLLRLHPGLTEALDPGAVAKPLQAMLAGGWVLEWCTPGKALVDLDTGVTLRYRVGLREVATGGTTEHLVGGRMFGSVESADAWLTERLQPLASRVGGRGDLSPFANPVLLVPDPRLVLHAFPIDPDLPGLLDATDEARLPQIFADVLAHPVEGLTLRECRAHVVQYARRGRCVLRYDAGWQLGATRRSVKQLLYGKVYADDHGAALGPATAAVRDRLKSAGAGEFRFLVPRVEGYLPDLRLALLEALPGAPQVPALVRERLAGTSTDGSRRLTLELALHTCARIAAALHASNVPAGDLRTLRDEVTALRTELEPLSVLAPALADLLSRRILTVESEADTSSPPAFGHGDFTPSQVLFDGPLSALVDLDTAGLMDPALDVGHFMAYLGLIARKAQAQRVPDDTPGDPERMFLDRYLDLAEIAPDDEQFGARVAAYRTLALVRIAARGWLQLKPARLRLALQMLDERPREPQLSRRGSGV